MIGMNASPQLSSYLTMVNHRAPVKGCPYDRRMRMDLRLALRRLARSPGFSLAAILLLGAGIALCTALFGLVDAVLLRPLPFRDPGRLAWIWATHTDRDRAFFSIPDF